MPKFRSRKTKRKKRGVRDRVEQLAADGDAEGGDVHQELSGDTETLVDLKDGE